jgi:hypothetical protein
VKITFEGSLSEIIDQMLAAIAVVEAPLKASMRSIENPPPLAAAVQGPGPDIFEVVEKPVEKPAEKPVGKSKPARTEKQLENDEKLRIAAKAKIAAKKAAREAAASTASMMPMPPPPATAESLGLAPDEVAKIKAKTILELQEAYANGFQKEVFELLSRFGNGAKSFRELSNDAFVPIREAIDNGALT